VAFKKGDRGNPRGNHRRTKHRLTRLAQDLVAQFAPGIVEAVLREDSAKADSQKRREARQLFFRFIWRPAKLNPDPFNFAVPKTLLEVRERLGELAKAFAGGALDLDVFTALTGALRAFDDVERQAVMQRLQEIEAGLEGAESGHQHGNGAAESHNI
jgi:hypothetical protein